MSSVGERLRRARQEAGLSIEAVSARTKITPGLLSAIERDDFDRLPKGIFTRGYLRAFAKEVGLDPDGVVAAYLSEYEPLPPPPLQVDESLEPIEPASSLRLAWPVVAVLLSVGTLYLIGQQSANTAADLPTTDAVSPQALPPNAPTPKEQVVGTAGREEAVPSVSPAGAVPQADGEDVVLEISPTGPVWVMAHADGARVLYRLVQAGETVSLKARDGIALRVGDAGAFRYTINGRPGRVLGGPGMVRDIRVDRETYGSLLETPQGRH